eukprot:8504921-Pyramimonas_sp.AAC.1
MSILYIPPEEAEGAEVAGARHDDRQRERGHVDAGLQRGAVHWGGPGGTRRHLPEAEFAPHIPATVTGY